MAEQQTDEPGERPDDGGDEATQPDEEHGSDLETAPRGRPDHAGRLRGCDAASPSQKVDRDRDRGDEGQQPQDRREPGGPGQATRAGRAAGSGRRWGVDEDARRCGDRDSAGGRLTALAGHEEPGQQHQPRPTGRDEGAQELVAQGPPRRHPQQRHADQPPDDRHQRPHGEHDDGGGLEPGPCGGVRRRNGGPHVLGCGGNDLLGLPEPVEQRPYRGLVGCRPRSASAIEVLPDLAEQLVATVRRQPLGGPVQPAEVLLDEVVDGCGHGVPPGSSESTESRKRRQSSANPFSARAPAGVMA